MKPNIVALIATPTVRVTSFIHAEVHDLVHFVSVVDEIVRKTPSNCYCSFRALRAVA